MYIYLYDGSKLYCDKIEIIGSRVMCDDIYVLNISDIDRIETA